ncbi:MAG: HU family DNA-binding protein [Thermoguttaceae bacterium]
MPQIQAKKFFQKVLDVITEVIVENGRIELRNFGVFEVKQRGPRIGINPMTREKVKIKAKKVVCFKPGKVMQDQVAEVAKKRKTKTAK